MTGRERIRNITIGVTDGLTIPLAVAAGLYGIEAASSLIATVCFAIAIAGAIPMTISAWLEAKKYERDDPPVQTALIIGAAYTCGGLIAGIPFLLISQPATAFIYSAAICLLLLFIGGYYDSKINGASPIIGAVRVTLTGAVAAGAAYGIATLFH